MKQNTIALIYDFDGTLTPKAMQEYALLQALGVKKNKVFWQNVDKKSVEQQADKDLLWMRWLTEMADKEDVALTKAYFKAQGKKISYFPGIPRYFDALNAYVKAQSKGKMKIRRCIVSSGLKEIIDGTVIKQYFHRVYGSEYHYGDKKLPDFPKVVINDTAKTQYIFRINKGRENIGESINDHMPEVDRPIPSLKA